MCLTKMRCSVYGCGNSNKIGSSSREVQFHGFPKDSKLQKQWIILCRREDEFNVKTAKVCSSHFDKDKDYMPEPSLLEEYGLESKVAKLKPRTVPSKCLPGKKLQATNVG